MARENFEASAEHDPGHVESQPQVHLHGGWVAAPDKRAERFSRATIYPFDPGRRAEVQIPLTSNPRDAAPMGRSSRTEEPKAE